jgi:hypothetical protein
MRKQVTKMLARLALKKRAPYKSEMRRLKKSWNKVPRSERHSLKLRLEQYGPDVMPMR